MKILYNEITKRFPEIQNRISKGDEELPYCLMNFLADWLKSLRQEALTPDVVNRMVDFSKWCKSQPRGESANNDIFTIFTVGFLEHIFDSETTRQLLPKLIPRQEIIAGADYFKAWVGAEDYEKALKKYK